jgi:hypothetical protein
MKKILLSLVVVMFCVSIMAQNSVNLKMNLEKNKVYRLNATSEQTVLQTINGNQQTTESKANNTISIKMIDATTDFIVTEIHFDTLKTSTNTMGKTMNISSTVEGNIQSAEISDVLSCIQNRMTKNALYVKMDYTGKPIEIINLKMFSDVIMKDTSSITLTGPMATVVKKQLSGMASDQTLKTMIGTFTHFLPGKQVTTGDNWNVTEQSNFGGMTLDIITSYHLDGVSDNSATVAAESNIKVPENAAPMESGGAKITYNDLKGLSKSNIAIDIHTGLIISESAKTHIAGNMGINAPGMSMQIPLEIDGNSKVIVLK